MTQAQATEKSVETAGGTRWQPDWVFSLNSGGEIGLVVDDHCFVVLTIDHNNQWHPSYHIPEGMADHIGRLAASGALSP